jgi:DegV family protein with EDD domain
MQAKNPVIVTDSNASLPDALVSDLPLLIVPMEIHHDGRVYHDGADLLPARFYELQSQPGPSPTTSSPEPRAFADAYRLASARSSSVVCLTLSAHLSATHEAARVAAEEVREELGGTRIEVIDTRSAGTAQGLVALEAARLAAAGGTTAQVLTAVERCMADVTLYGYLDSLYYVWRSGRVPRVAWWMGNLLGIKPVLQLREGKIGMIERPRTEAKAMSRLVTLVVNRLAGRRARVAVMHANAPAKAAVLAKRLAGEIEIEELFVTEFTPVIAAHTGPGLVGCALHPVDG